MPDGTTIDVGIERLHLEQDAGKSMHDQHPSKSYIDLNGTGVRHGNRVAARHSVGGASDRLCQKTPVNPAVLEPVMATWKRDRPRRREGLAAARWPARHAYRDQESEFLALYPAGYRL